MNTIKKIAALSLLAPLLLTGCTLPVANPYSAPPLPAEIQAEIDASRGKAAPEEAAEKEVVEKEVPEVAAVEAVEKEPEPVVEAVTDTFVGDLDTGSVTHVLPAGGFDVGVDYWSTLSAEQWKEGAVKPVNLSLRVQPHDEDSLRVYLQRMSVKSVSGGKLLGTSEDVGAERGYAVTPPYSYNGAFVLDPGAVTDGQVTVTLQYDLLVRTKAGSDDYFKQTVLDTLTLKVFPDEPVGTEDPTTVLAAER